MESRRDQEDEPAEPPVFRHPTWMVGVVVVLGVAALVAGFGDPVWWWIGAPCILTAALYFWVRLVAR